MYWVVGEFVEVNVGVEHVQKDEADILLQKMPVAVDMGLLVVGKGLSSVLDLILEVQEAAEVVIVGVVVVGAVPVETGPQIQDFPVNFGCSIVVVDYAQT